MTTKKNIGREISPFEAFGVRNLHSSFRLLPGATPTVRQEALLKAALFQGKDFYAALEFLKAHWNLKDFSEREQRILPLLYNNLKQHGEKLPEMQALEAKSLVIWGENHRRARHLTPVLMLLNNLNIPVTLLKGLAVNHFYFKDYAHRGMYDVDFWVPMTSVTPALDALLKAGWAMDSSSAFAKRPLHEAVCFSHAVGLKNPLSLDIDLHWHLSPSRPWANFDDALLKDAQTGDFHGRPVRHLGCTSQLIHTCVHGAITPWEDHARNVHWILDLNSLLQGYGSSVDWKRVMAIAVQFKLARCLGSALSYVQKNFKVPVPEGFLSELEKLPLSRIEKWEEKIFSNPSHDRRAGNLPWFGLTYFLYKPNLPGRPGARQLVEFLKFMKNVSTTRELFFATIKRVFKVLAGKWRRDLTAQIPADKHR